MTDIDTSHPPFRAAFEFGKALRHPEIRERLRLLGFDSDAGDVAMTTWEDETFIEACQRAPIDARRTLLVARDEESVGGWWMAWAQEVDR